MDSKTNMAAIKVLEAAKLIQSVKDPKVKERNERILRGLWQFGAELLAEDVKGPAKDK